jgi:hypothetical protein
VFAKVLSAILELVTNQADSVEVSSHCEFLIFGLGFLCACSLLCEGLLIEGKGQCYVAPDLACVKGAVETY